MGLRQQLRLAAERFVRTVIAFAVGALSGGIAALLLAYACYYLFSEEPTADPSAVPASALILGIPIGLVAALITGIAAAGNEYHTPAHLPIDQLLAQEQGVSESTRLRWRLNGLLAGAACGAAMYTLVHAIALSSEPEQFRVAYDVAVTSLAGIAAVLAAIDVRRRVYRRLLWESTQPPKYG